jgi:uncharacterized glyoxalase superfamily protein PhnB
VASKFYVEKLGFTEAMTGESFAVMTRGNVVLGLIGSKTAAGTSWCYLTVSNPTALFAEYQNAGVTIKQPLQTWGEHTEFTITDPEGNRMDIGN